MRMYDIIRKKRDGLGLSEKEIQWFVDGYVKGEIPDYQTAALCMAIYFKGMTIEETTALTFAIRLMRIHPIKRYHRYFGVLDDTDRFFQTV